MKSDLDLEIGIHFQQSEVMKKDFIGSIKEDTDGLQLCINLCCCCVFNPCNKFIIPQLG